jgi:hypothetical protein
MKAQGSADQSKGAQKIAPRGPGVSRHGLPMRVVVLAMRVPN